MVQIPATMLRIHQMISPQKKALIIRYGVILVKTGLLEPSMLPFQLIVTTSIPI